MMLAVAVVLALATLSCTVTTERDPNVATAAPAEAQPVVPQPVAVDPPPPSPPPPASAAPPPPRPQPSRALDRRVKDVISAAQNDGWNHKRTVIIPDRQAAIVLYAPTPEKAPAHKSMRADAVGVSGEPVTVQSGVIDVALTRRKRVLWDLTGAGEQFVILTLAKCQPHCDAPQPLVLELGDDDVLRKAAAAPECPTCIQDADNDGIPEFTHRMIELEIAPCSRVSCGPENALVVQVQGFESWDGQRYARNLKAFVPLYQKRLERARAEIKRVRGAGKKQRVCPLDAIRVAAELFAYGRLTGVSELAAFKEADRVMAGYTTAQCNAEYDLLASPRTWIQLRSELVSEKLPVLDAERQRPAR